MKVGIQRFHICHMINGYGVILGNTYVLMMYLEWNMLT